MRHPRLFPLLVLALLVLLVSACGGGSSTTGSSTASTKSTDPDLAASQSPQEGSPRPPTPLPGHPKIDSESGDGSAARHHRGSSSPPARSRTGEPKKAARPAPGHAQAPGGGGGEMAEQHRGARASAPAAAPTSRRHRQGARGKLESQAGAAAPFLVAQGDNSIPTYGSEASGPQLAAAEGTLSGYLSARAEGAWASACSLMSGSVAGQLGALAGEAGAGQSCAAAYAKLSERVPAAERADPLTQGLAAVRIESSPWSERTSDTSNRCDGPTMAGTQAVERTSPSAQIERPT